MLHARRHDLHPVGGRAVEIHQMACLGLAGGAHDVRAGHHLLLGAGARWRLRLAEGLLHPGEGMERGHERSVEGVLDPVTGHAGQPVVGVDRIDVASPGDVG